MTGLFELYRVAELSKDRETPFEGILGKAIREASDTSSGRDVPQEDFYHSVLTYWRLRDDTFLFRFAPINDKGQPYGNITTVQTLKDITLSMLRAKMQICTTIDNVERYDYFYNPRAFEHTRFLYVPDNKWVQTGVAIYRTGA